MTTKGTRDYSKVTLRIARHIVRSSTPCREKNHQKSCPGSLETGTGGEGAEHFPMLLRSDPPSIPVFRTGDGRHHLYKRWNRNGINLYRHI